MKIVALYFGLASYRRALPPEKVRFPLKTYSIDA